MVDCRTATRLVVTVHAVLSISGLQLQAAPKGALLSFNWPGEPDAARWHLGDEVTVEAEEIFGKNQVRPFKETRYLRCGVPEDTSVSSSAILKRIKVKPDTGYTAQVWVNYYGGSALTFGILKVSTGDFDPGAYHDSFVEWNMCGIAGLSHIGERIEPRMIRMMADLLKHRGPDDERYLAVDTCADPPRVCHLRGPDSTCHDVPLWRKFR